MNNVATNDSANSSGTSMRAQLFDGLWKNNPALVQLLGLCPLLAVSNSAINGLALGLATALTVFLSNVVVSTCRHIILPEIRIPIFVIIISGIVTLVPGVIHTFDYHQLCNSGASRIVCSEEPGICIFHRRLNHRCRICMGVSTVRCDSRVYWLRHYNGRCQSFI